MRATYFVMTGALLLGSIPGMARAATPAAGAQDSQLASVLAKMDAGSARFKSAQANFSWDQYTAVVQDHDIQQGNIAFRRSGNGIEMVAHVLTENGQSAPKDVLYRDGQLDLYQPPIHQETILDAGKNKDQFESYATLGFGGSGKDLEAQWNVQYEGASSIGGVPVVKLGLTPKHPGANPMFSRIEIWLDPATDTSRKQIFYTPGGDTRTALYTDVKLNSVSDSAFRLRVPSGTNVVHK